MTIKKINNAIWNRIYTAFVKSVFHKYSIRYGKNLFVMNDLPILHLSQQHGNIEIGDNFTINSSNNETSWYSKSAITVKYGASLIIGNNVGINGALIYCSNEVTIGDFSIIGGQQGLWIPISIVLIIRFVVIKNDSVNVFQNQYI